MKIYSPRHERKRKPHHTNSTSARAAGGLAKSTSPSTNLSLLKRYFFLRNKTHSWQYFKFIQENYKPFLHKYTRMNLHHLSYCEIESACWAIETTKYPVSVIFCRTKAVSGFDLFSATVTLASV